jgi:hypothetical protein
VTNPSIAGLAPFGALVLAIVGGAALSAGDQRAGLFPWTIAVAAALLALCCLGIVRLHEPDVPARVLMGGGGSAFGFAAVAAAFVAFGLGDVTGLADSASGPVAALPMLLAGTGIVTIPIANGMLAAATRRAGVLDRRGVWALWAVTPVIPLTLIASAVADGPGADSVPGIGIGLAGVGWVVVGLALRATDQ